MMDEVYDALVQLKNLAGACRGMPTMKSMVTPGSS